MTHDIMERHPVAGERFGPILHCDGHGDRAMRDDELRVWKHEHSTPEPTLRRGMVAGYTGSTPVLRGRRVNICKSVDHCLVSGAIQKCSDAT